MAGQETTTLSPQDETAFRAWVQSNGIRDVDHSQSFYDYRGYWKDVAARGTDQRKRYNDGLHFPDTYKQHGHPTFSVESKYSRGPSDGGRWNGETYVPQSVSSQAAEVVIVGDDGTEHVFPPGFDPKRAAAIVRKGAAQQTPAVKSGMLDHLIDLLPAAGGTVGGIVGGIGGTVAGMGVGGVPGAMGGATLGGGAGEALRQLVNRARGAKSPASSLDALIDITKEGGIQGAAEGVGGAVMKGATSGARAVYRGYLKPSIAAKNAPKAAQVVETALREAIPISPAGAAFDKSGRVTGKAGRVIEDMRAEVDAEVKAAGGTIDLKRIANRVRRAAKLKYDKPGADPADLKAAMDVADRIDSHPSLKVTPGSKGPIPVSVSKANETKRALQDAARSSYGTPNAAAKKEAEKTAARKLRIAVEGGTGGRTGAVAQLNDREAKLISAAKAIAQAVEREANQNPLYGVKTLASAAVGGGYGYKEGGAPGALAGTAASRALLRPASASWAAIIANRIAKQLGVGAASATRLADYVLSNRSEDPEDSAHE